MTFPSHILMGVIIGQLTGNMTLSIAVSVLIDIDHAVSYIKHGILWKPKKFFKTITDTDDPYGDQRGYLHNIIIAGIISGLPFFISLPIGITFSAAYFGHLLLDALDQSDYWPLFPYKGINVRGFVHYYSWQEITIDVILVAIIIALSLV